MGLSPISPLWGYGRPLLLVIGVCAGSTGTGQARLPCPAVSSAGGVKGHLGFIGRLDDGGRGVYQLYRAAGGPGVREAQTASAFVAGWGRTGMGRGPVFVAL